MPARLCSARSLMPLVGPPKKVAMRPRRSVHVSVTVHPSSVGSNVYAHVATASPTELTSKTKDRPGEHSVTVAFVLQCLFPLALVPLNEAPTAGPDAPLTQVPPVASGDHSPMRGRSATSDQTTSAGASMSRDTEKVRGASELMGASLPTRSSRRSAHQRPRWDAVPRPAIVTPGVALGVRTA